MKTALITVGFLICVLIYFTWLNYRKPKRKPPQDHYYAERKDKDTM